MQELKISIIYNETGCAGVQINEPYRLNST
jgi:hypothetical protein